jgi:carbon monoxide dehydrogenase subunit G
MLKLSGDKDFRQSPAEAWPQLSDARFIVTCIPDVTEVSRAEPSLAEFKVRPGFSFVRGTLSMVLTVTEAREPISVAIRVIGKGIGSSSTVEAMSQLTPSAAGTHLHWQADIVDLGGLLKAVPQGLIQAAAQKVIADLWTMVETKLGSPSK